MRLEFGGGASAVGVAVLLAVFCLQGCSDGASDVSQRKKYNELSCGFTCPSEGPADGNWHVGSTAFETAFFRAVVRAARGSDDLVHQARVPELDLALLLGLPGDSNLADISAELVVRLTAFLEGPLQAEWRPADCPLSLPMASRLAALCEVEPEEPPSSRFFAEVSGSWAEAGPFPAPVNVGCNGTCDGGGSEPPCGAFCFGTLEFSTTPNRCRTSTSVLTRLDSTCSPGRLSFSYSLSAATLAEPSVRREAESLLRDVRGPLSQLLSIRDRARELQEITSLLAREAEGAFASELESLAVEEELSLTAAIGLGCSLDVLPEVVDSLGQAHAQALALDEQISVAWAGLGLGGEQ